MRMTSEELEVCNEYRQKDSRGYARCNECPLVLSKAKALCKRLATSEQIDRYGFENKPKNQGIPTLF